MSILYYKNNVLHIEEINLQTIAAEYGTPCYIYSKAAIEKNWLLFDNALKQLPHKICYAVKANSNINILRLLTKLNSSFDIVSLGELERVLAAGGAANKIIFSGVGKSQVELESALNLNVFCINIESEAELNRLEQTASLQQKKISIALRVNPNIDGQTHQYISTGLKENKFGIEIKKTIALCQQIATSSHLQLIGLACHIGSQIIDLEPFSLALDQLIHLYHQLDKLGISIQYFNIGGGLGIAYQNETVPSINEYADLIHKKIASLPVEVIIEPGRAIAGNAGILLTTIEYVKTTSDKNFAIVDAAMNDLLRPALYHAWQPILPVNLLDIEKNTYDIVGPVCESADFLGKNRELAIQVGNLLAIDMVGAYGFSMSSNYNSRPRPAEILIDQHTSKLIRRRETIHELFASEIFDH